MKIRGFTLIELLVVIAIIGVLAGIIVASTGTARDQAKDARKVADIDQILNSLALYYNDNDDWPASTSNLATDYISAVPLDPDGSSYTYSTTSLCACMESHSTWYAAGKGPAKSAEANDIDTITGGACDNGTNCATADYYCAAVCP